MPALRFGPIVRALAAALQITPDALPAFEARIRHLRSLGVPAVKFVRSGIAAEYRREHAVEMLLSLELQRLGQAPKASVTAARSIMRMCDTSPASGDEHTFVTFESADSPSYTVCVGREVFLDWFQRSEPSGFGFTLLDVTAAIAALDAALSNPE